MSSADSILLQLKKLGEQTAAQLAATLGLTSMGVRKHLLQLEEQGLLETLDKIEGRGRPARYWRLTAAGHARYPDRHAEMTAQLLTLLRAQLGEAALESLVIAREGEMLAQYQARLDGLNTTAERLAALAAARSEEGYMAELQAHEQGWLLIEHHCPICSAAKVCQGFCRSELAQFQTLLPEAQVSREQHLLGGDQRCVYLIRQQ